MRRIGLRFFAAGVIALSPGCNKSSPPNKALQHVEQGETIARVHWLGKQRIARERNAAYFLGLWVEPESAKLEAQTLDKLSTAPWRLLGLTNQQALVRTVSTNFPSASLLRPLLDDLIQEESYLEIRQPTNQPGELAFAIRLNDRRADLWETNLAAVLESLAGSRAVLDRGTYHGWQLSIPSPAPPDTGHPTLIPRRIALSRAGGWTVVGLGQDRNALLGDILARIQFSRVPFSSMTTNYWLEANLDLRRIANALAIAWNVSEDAPKFYLNVFGDGENVRTRGRLDFPRALTVELAPWRIPTNLVSEPLISFTAARGIAPLLRKIRPFSDFRSQPVPDQLFLWDRAQPPFATFFAVPVENAVNAFSVVAPPIMNWINSGVSAEKFGSISIDTNTSSMKWNGLVFAAPFVQAVTNSGQEFLFGGFSPHVVLRTNRMPDELLAHILEGTNLVFFDWEITGQRLSHWRYLDDVSRIISDASHLARLRTESASIQWISANLTNLSHSLTEVRLTDTNRLAFTRKSSAGFTALELDILANWLEVPQFPYGLNTLLRTNPTPLIIRRRTNTVPVKAP